VTRKSTIRQDKTAYLEMFTIRYDRRD